MRLEREAGNQHANVDITDRWRICVFLFPISLRHARIDAERKKKDMFLSEDPRQGSALCRTVMRLELDSGRWKALTRL